MSHSVFLSLGTNLGDRESNLGQAVAALALEISIDSISSVYETRPVGVVDQPRFLNLAVAARTGRDPHSLLQLTQGVEQELGRKRTFRWGPRLIDVDILLYDDAVLRDHDLTIPHPELERRAFVLVPLAEIAPDVGHPILGRTIKDLCQAVEGRDGVLRVGPFAFPTDPGGPHDTQLDEP